MNTTEMSINELFSKDKNEDKNIRSFFLYYKDNLEETDPILFLLHKACLRNNLDKIPEITDDDVALLNDGKQYLRNIKSYETFFEFLIMCNTKDETVFVDSFNRLIDSYFVLKKEKLIETNDIIFLLNCSISYSEQFGEKFIRKIFKEFIKRGSNMYYVLILNSIIERYGIKKIKKFKNINLVFDSLLKSDEVKFQDSNQYISLAEYCILFNKNSKDSKAKYIDVVLKILPDINDSWFQGKVQKCRDYIKDTKYQMEKLLDVENKIEFLGEKASTMMQEIEVPLPPEAVSKLEEMNNKRLEFLARMSNVDKLKWYLLEVYPFKKVELLNFENSIEDKSVFAGFFNTIYYDNKKEVINYTELSEDDKNTLKCRSGFHALSNLLEFTLCRVFYKSFKFDEEVKDFINELSKNNKMIDLKNRWDTKFVDYFSDLLSGKTDDLIQKVLPLFEHSLRFYFKNEGLYIKKTDSNDFINLGDIFNGFDKENIYRTKLLQTIDEDYYWMFCYLLTDRFGFNARNANLHGADDSNFSRSFTAYYVCVLIFRLYLGFCNG